MFSAFIQTNSVQETMRIGEVLGQIAKPGDCIGLIGELGAGKTVFAKGFAKGLQCKEKVQSPTFLFMLEYTGRYPLKHLDAYFAAKEAHFIEEAATDLFHGQAVVLVEWAERVAHLLPRDRLEIKFEHLGAEQRKLYFHGLGQRGRELQTFMEKTIS